MTFIQEVVKVQRSEQLLGLKEMMHLHVLQIVSNIRLLDEFHAFSAIKFRCALKKWLLKGFQVNPKSTKHLQKMIEQSPIN